MFRALPLLLLPAIALLWRRRRDLAAIYALLGAATLLAAATHAEIRLSIPLGPLMFVVLAAAIVELARRLAAARSRRTGAPGPAT